MSLQIFLKHKLCRFSINIYSYQKSFFTLYSLNFWVASCLCDYDHNRNGNSLKTSLIMPYTTITRYETSMRATLKRKPTFDATLFSELP